MVKLDNHNFSGCRAVFRCLRTLFLVALAFPSLSAASFRLQCTEDCHETATSADEKSALVAFYASTGGAAKWRQ